MALIDLKKAVIELSDESFSAFKDSTEDYFWRYYLSKDEITRPVMLEKIGEYLRFFEMQCKCRDNDLANEYASYLIRYLDNRIVTAKTGEIPNSAERYYNRAGKIIQSIKSVEDKDSLLTLMEDFTKIFVCLYSEYLKNERKAIRNISFHLASVDIDMLIDSLLQDTPTDKTIQEMTPEGLKNFIPGNILKGADDFRKGIADMQKGMQDAQKGLAAEIKKRVAKADSVYEPVHDFIEKCEKHDIYEKEDFINIMLRLMYYRVKDFELGLN